MLGKIESRRRRRQQKMRCLDGISNSMNISLSKLQEIMKDSEDWGAAVHVGAKSWTQLSNWAIKCTSPPEILWPQWAGQLLLLLGNQTSPKESRGRQMDLDLEWACRGCQGGWATTDLSMQIQGSNLHRENVITQIGKGPGSQGLDRGSGGGFFRI